MQQDVGKRQIVNTDDVEQTHMRMHIYIYIHTHIHIILPTHTLLHATSCWETACGYKTSQPLRSEVKFKAKEIIIIIKKKDCFNKSVAHLHCRQPRRHSLQHKQT